MKVIEALETGISIDAPSGKVTIDPPTHHCVLDVHIAEVADKKLGRAGGLRAAEAGGHRRGVRSDKEPQRQSAIRHQDLEVRRQQQPVIPANRRFREGRRGIHSPGGRL